MQKTDLIQILIPTYNRDEFIKKNLELLVRQVLEDNLQKKISILISNNCSTDNTKLYVNEVINSTANVKIKLHNQETNIGLEKNAIWLLEQTNSEYIVFLGDDDYLPEHYLKYLIDVIENDSHVTCILPGLNGLMSDGSIIPSRIESFEEKLYDPTFKTLCQLSHIGHQMSGVLIKKDDLYEKYTFHDDLRNIYPFIFFVAYCISMGRTIYVPKYKVHVSIENSKDWKYDDSGLLTEIFKNYKILFYDHYVKRNVLNIVYVYKQPWRLRIHVGWNVSVKAFKHLIFSKETEILTKLGLVALFAYFYLKSIRTKGSNK